MNKTSQWMRGRTMAAVACAALALPMIGCGSGGSTTADRSSMPPIDDTRGGAAMSYPQGNNYAQTAQPRQGMSTGKKVMILAGAAALYYLYRKHQSNKQGATTTENGQPVYYLSKNGRVYYRDANHQAHWVTPPAEGIQVPYDEAQQYSQFQGYNNQQTGITDLSRFAPQGAGSMGGGY